MDPLSIAASACGIATVCGSIVVNVSKFIVDARQVSHTLEEFTTTITSLRTVLNNVDITVSKRPKQLPFAQKQERKHWLDVKNVLEACNGCLYKLNNELPQLREDSHKSLVQARMQLEMSLKSNVVMQIQGHLSSYTQVLQLSLTTMTLGSMWETQQSQDYMRAEIQKLTEEIRRTNMMRQEQRQHERSYQTSHPDLRQDLTLEEMLANRNIDAWRESAESLAAAVTLYDPDEQSEVDRAELGSVWSGSNLPALDEIRRNEISERIDAVKVGTEAGSMGHPDSGVEVSETASDWDPEPDNMYYLSVDILKCQIAANQENVNRLLNDGIFFQAEQYQRKGIELRDQLEKMHNIPFSDKADAEETMADIFMRQKGTKEALVQAKDILQRLLKQEVQRELLPDDDRSRCWRLYHKLAAVYIELGYIPKAKIFATRALEGRKKLVPLPKDLVLESADLLARTCQLGQEFDEARGLRIWIHEQDLHLVDAGDMEKTDHGLPNPAMADAIRWCKEKGFDVDSPGFQFDTPGVDGKTPLHVAVSDEKLDIVEQIVDHVATLETPDHDESTALLLACATRNRRTTEILLKHGAIVNVKDKYLNTPLHRVHAAAGGIAVAKLVLDQRGHNNDINCKNSYDKTALHLACQMGNEPMVELLLERGADINCPGPGQCTPLHVAIDQRRLAIVKVLLEHGADISIRDAAGRNALRAAKTTKLASPDINRLLQGHDTKLQERHRRLSHSRSLSIDEPSGKARQASSSSQGRRDTVLSNTSIVSGVSTGSAESSGSSPKSPRSRLGFRIGRKHTSD